MSRYHLSGVAKAGALLTLAWLLGAQAPASPPPVPAPPAATHAAKLPTAIDPSFAHYKPGRARRKTCSVQYKANKADGGNAGLKWPAYYKACNTKLKTLG